MTFLVKEPPQLNEGANPQHWHLFKGSGRRTFVCVRPGVLNEGRKLGKDVHPSCVGLWVPGCQLDVPANRNKMRYGLYGVPHRSIVSQKATFVLAGGYSVKSHWDSERADVRAVGAHLGGQRTSSRNSSILLTSVLTSPLKVMNGGWVPGARFWRSAGFLEERRSCFRSLADTESPPFSFQ